jgi:hypothetical protein
VGLVKTSGDDEGKPVRGLIDVWLLGDLMRGSIVDGTPTGGVGVSVGAEGELAPVWARAGAAMSSAAPSASVTVRACVMANLLVSLPAGGRARRGQWYAGQARWRRRIRVAPGRAEAELPPARAQDSP